MALDHAGRDLYAIAGIAAAAVGGGRVTVWFTVQLDDKPGSLARVATALAERSVNITGIVGVAEDTDGALMLTTSDAARRARRSGRSGSPSRSTTRRAGCDEQFSGRPARASPIAA